jgi:hypothetical protein
VITVNLCVPKELQKLLEEHLSLLDFKSSFRFTTDAFDFNLNRATKWHNLNNRGCKPTVNNKLNISALKGLNIRLV